MALLVVADLTPFASIDSAKAEQMIVDAVAMATLAAPCLEDEGALSLSQLAQVKSILRAAVLRWNDVGSGAFSQEAIGPFSATFDTRQARRAMFWPSEINDLQKVCKGQRASSAFSVDTMSNPTVLRDPWCDPWCGFDYLP